MNKLKKTIEQYGRWAELSIYIGRIETHIESDFSHSLENAKALLETIGKEICSTKGIQNSRTANKCTNAVFLNLCITLRVLLCSSGNQGTTAE